MITQNHILQIRNRFYYLAHNFGGPHEFIEVLLNNNDDDFAEYLVHKVLSHPDTVKVITPWSIRFNLIDRDFSGNSQKGSIALEKPYAIYDLNHRLIYKVVEHGGIWGDSSLDKTLVIQSLSGSMFYLQFHTYSGTRTWLLIVNNLALRPTNVLSDDDSLVAPSIKEDSGDHFLSPAEEPKDNQIHFLGKGLIRSNLPNRPYFPIKVHILPGSPSTIPSREEVMTNSSSITTTYPLMEDELEFIMFPSESGWLTINQDKGTVQIPLTIDNVRGNGADRFIQANEHVWYIAVGDEIDTVLLRHKLGTATRRPPDFSSRDILKLKADIHV